MASHSGLFHCICCSFSGDSVESLEGHIASEHLKYFPFECFYCQYVRLPTEHFLHQHMEQQHPGQTVKSVYAPEQNQRRILARLLLSSTGGNSIQRAIAGPEEDGNSESNYSLKFEDARTNRLFQTTTGAARKPFPTSSVEITELQPTEEPVEQTKPLSPSKSPRKKKISPAKKKTAAKKGVAKKVSEQTETKKIPLALSPSGSEQIGDEDTKTPPEQARKGGKMSKTTSHRRICKICNKVDTSSTLVHCMAAHLNKQTVFCPYCKHSIKGHVPNMLTHIRLLHKGKEVKVIDRRNEHFQEIRRIHKECFPEKMLLTRQSLGLTGALTESPASPAIKEDFTPLEIKKSESLMKIKAKAKQKSLSKAKTPKSAAPKKTKKVSPQKNRRISAPAPELPNGDPSAVMPVGQNLLQKEGVACVLCNQVLYNTTNILVHVMAYHLGKIQLWCGYCGYKNGGNISNLKQHMLKLHPGKDMQNFKDERLKHYDEMRALVLKCFPGTTPLDKSRFVGMPDGRSSGNSSRSKRQRKRKSNPIQPTPKSLPTTPLPQQEVATTPVRKSKRNVQHIPWNAIINGPVGWGPSDKKVKVDRKSVLPHSEPAEPGVSRKMSGLELSALKVQSIKERYRSGRSPSEKLSDHSNPELSGDISSNEEEDSLYIDSD